MNEQLKKLLEGSPEALPHALAERYPRIVERIVRAWSSPQDATALFDDLLVDRRGGRQGFPPDVAREIFNLSVAYERTRAQPQKNLDVWSQERERATADIEGFGMRPVAADMLRTAEGGDTDRLMLFLRAGMNVDTRDAREWTPLMVASFNGNEAAAKLLIEHGADPQVRDRAGYTPLHWAALKGYQEVVALLARRVDVNAQSNSGLTALLQAAAGGHAAVVKLLFAAGADPNLATVEGWTPLHKAVANGHEEVVSLLLDAGATVFVRHLDGTTPMSLAAKAKRADILSMLQASRSSSF